MLTIALLLAAGKGYAQYPSDLKYGIRIGADLSRIAMHYVQPARTDVEINGDARIDSNLYIAVDAGWNRTHVDNKPEFAYRSSGIFGRFGIDYNMLKPQFPFENSIVYVGFRYGIARMQRTIPYYLVTDPYWGNTEGSFDKRTLMPQWVEAVVGMKAEVLQNLFLGWSLRLRVLATPNVDKQVRPYVIPGYGKGMHNAIFDFNYSISYKIPLWTPRPKAPKPSKKETAPPEGPAELLPAPTTPATPADSTKAPLQPPPPA
ncbi:DUF6048 family protein [Compostibacter hankyongensis]|uniref:DUF6048 family protein n=1 Tax=Compostibacter hankyongensis TaxID=1007089 RepID=A0ABP8FI31_9BACT